MSEINIAIESEINIAVELGTLFIENRCELLKTGQTIKYHEGDDGDLELGVAPDFTVLTTGQYSGTTNITINGKTHALSNNCVKDNRTGKMWARYVPNADIGPDNNGKLFWEDTVNGENIWAFAAKDAEGNYIGQANENNLAGHSDWRIPNYHELPSIVDIGHCNPAIDTTIFPSTPLTYHWTMSTTPCNTAYAFYVRFNSGHVRNASKQAGMYYVRLVRG